MSVRMLVNEARYGLRLAGPLTRRDGVDGSRRSSLDELTGWTIEAERVLVF